MIIYFKYILNYTDKLFNYYYIFPYFYLYINMFFLCYQVSHSMCSTFILPCSILLSTSPQSYINFDIVLEMINPDEFLAHEL